MDALKQIPLFARDKDLKMKKCPFCRAAIEGEAMVCQSCGRVPGSAGIAGNIFYCPRCNTEDTYCDSTNRIFCPRCMNYVKDQE